MNSIFKNMLSQYSPTTKYEHKNHLIKNSFTEALINKKNPDWKVLVTERGFVRDSSPAAWNDTLRVVNDGGSSGDEAATTSSPSP
ncbi:hypothetical protein FACS189426_15320 [Bacteroidia bacterium]|nr:hypothetical protein FACS189426_15320 [Bacteroidia bacterium]